MRFILGMVAGIIVGGVMTVHMMNEEELRVVDRHNRVVGPRGGHGLGTQLCEETK